MCALDSTIFEPCSSPQPYDNIPSGEHTFEVFALAQFGTPDPEPAIFEWISGTTVAPDVTINFAPPETGGTATSGTIWFSSTDPEATFLCILDSGPELPCSATTGFQYADLLAGEQNPHTFTVTATRADLLPSVTVNEAIHEWMIVDDAAPVTILLEPLPSDPSANEVTFTFTGTDNGTIPQNLDFECLLDSGELGDGVFLNFLPLSRVEAVLEGPRDEVYRVVGLCRAGPNGAQVSGVQVDREAPKNERTFKVK
jgi:hypothetical protein